MASTLQVLARSPLPGTGIDASGNPVQEKQQVLVQMTVSSYAAGGEAMTPRSVGLQTIDFVHPVVTTLGGITQTAGTASVQASWDPANELIIVEEIAATLLPEIGADAPIIGILVVGDSLLAPDLLP